MSYLDTIRKSLEGPLLSNDPLSKPIEGSIFCTVEYKIDTIVERLETINDLSDKQIKDIILRQYHMIFNYDLFLKSPKERACAQKLFSNKRFLKVLLEVIGLLQLNREQVVCINKLTYDYYILKDKDPEVSTLLLQISFQVNNQLSIRLSSILGINNAKILSMVANSSFQEKKNIHRVNIFLVKCNMDLSIQNMIDIFCILFEKFTYPFIYTMLETKTILSVDQTKRFDHISVAILEILNSMISQDIEYILRNYGYILKLNAIKQLRFSLKSAIGYTRIQEIIRKIELEDPEGIIIP